MSASRPRRRRDPSPRTARVGTARRLAAATPPRPVFDLARAPRYVNQAGIQVTTRIGKDAGKDETFLLDVLDDNTLGALVVCDGEASCSGNVDFTMTAASKAVPVAIVCCKKDVRATGRERGIDAAARVRGPKAAFRWFEATGRETRRRRGVVAASSRRRRGGVAAGASRRRRRGVAAGASRRGRRGGVAAGTSRRRRGGIAARRKRLHG